MSGLPLPLRIRELLSLDSPANRSLLFDKGMDRYDTAWRIGAGEKEAFLQDFARLFQSAGTDYPSFLARREKSLKDVGIQPIPFVSQTRLVIGLGLPSPIETGFLFDRLIGCPYLPGSTVKGLLRAAARLVRQDELGGDKDFWNTHFERIFGPEIAPGSVPRTGEAIFHDAFPACWPHLEVDVLTPHYGEYYREGAVPGDWDNPVPVPFLTVAAGTPFHFYIRAEKNDFDPLSGLLSTALDWLGIGAKKAAGYGIFGQEAPPLPQQPSAQVPRTRRPEPPPPPPPPPKIGLLWENAELSMRQGSVIARRGKQAATCRRADVELEVLESLAHNRTLRADVEVLKISGSEFRLVRVKGLRTPGQ